MGRWDLVTALFEDATTDCPVGVLTLTTRDPLHAHGKAFPRAVAKVMERLRERWPVQYCGLIEFTTGKAATSGGHRRMHMHALIKGIPPGDLAAAGEIARGEWERRMGAHRVELAPLASRGGIIGYLGGLHHSKQAQRPPKAWKGRTLRVSRHYWNQPVADVRAAAKSVQADRRRLWMARRQLGQNATVEEIELYCTIEREAAAAHRWRVVEVRGVLPVRELGARGGKRYHAQDETAQFSRSFWAAVHAGGERNRDAVPLSRSHRWRT